MPKLIWYGALGCALGIVTSFLGMWLSDGSGFCAPACQGAWLVVLGGLVMFSVGALVLLVAVFVSALQKLRESAVSSLI